MMMRCWLGLLLLVPAPQDEALKTLLDPARRAHDGARKAAATAFKAKSGDPAAFIAGRFLEKSDKDWKLAGDPLAPVFDAYLKEYWTGTPLDEARHRKALESLGAALEKAKSEAREAPLLFLAFHASALGDRASDVISRHGFTKDGDRWGRRDELLLAAVARGLKGGAVSGDTEKAARSSAAFAPRYALLLLDLNRAFTANQGYEAVHKTLTLPPGPNAPPAAAAHYKALAESLKAATYCRACKDGKAGCVNCQGRKRADFPCPVCHTIGWMQKPGSPQNTLIKCTRCAGAGVFRNANCPPCKATGLTDCVVCTGKPWRDGFKGCKDCRPCDSCKGLRKTETPCTVCSAKGRTGPFVAGIPTTLCSACNGNASIFAVCAVCKETALAACAPCGGAGVRDGKARVKVSDVHSGSPCGACGGSGYPLPHLALPCGSCLGLGLLALPASNPAAKLGD